MFVCNRNLYPKLDIKIYIIDLKAEINLKKINEEMREKKTNKII